MPISIASGFNYAVLKGGSTDRVPAADTGHHSGHDSGGHDSATMKKYCLVVCAGIGNLQTVPIWRGVVKFGVTVSAWRAHVDRERIEESLTLELTGITPARLEEFVSYLTDGDALIRASITSVSV